MTYLVRLSTDCGNNWQQITAAANGELRDLILNQFRADHGHRPEYGELETQGGDWTIYAGFNQEYQLEIRRNLPGRRL